MSDLAYRRMELYSALAEAFKYPSVELLCPSPENFLLNALDEFSKEVHVQDIKNEAKSLVRWLSNRSKVTAPQTLDQLEVEYNRLFASPFAPLVYPYESVYLDSDGLVMGQSAVAVLRQYGEAGLALSPEFKDLPDHIVVELEFMAYICAKEAEANLLKHKGGRSEYLGKEADFIKKHLSMWAFTFCDRIITASSSAFYPSLARILSAYLYWEEQYVTRTLETTETTSTKNMDNHRKVLPPLEQVIPQVELASCISCGKPYMAKTALAKILEKLDADGVTEALRHATMCCPQCKRNELRINKRRLL